MSICCQTSGAQETGALACSIAPCLGLRVFICVRMLVHMCIYVRVSDTCVHTYVVCIIHMYEYMSRIHICACALINCAERDLCFILYPTS